MKIPFVKMQAQGNDFVILNGIIDALPTLTQTFVTKLCDRHIGIGCDQLLVLKPHETADALMLIYNADGSQAGNCGNGLRCVADILMQQTGKSKVCIALADRMVSAEHTVDGVQVAMGEVIIEKQSKDYTDVWLGNPHRVYFEQTRTCLERNVEIIHSYDEHHANIRIIERGAGETLACGSGACATAVAVWQRLGVVVSPLERQSLEIQMPGGKVVVHRVGIQVYLIGVVSYVFSGHYVCV
ncbi:MAG: diaminopimelate epimerase [Ghiorsea sp.]|nr:diaminopimelate epimerase [Ghiorsea sp.]